MKKDEEQIINTPISAKVGLINPDDLKFIMWYQSLSRFQKWRFRLMAKRAIRKG